MLAVLYYRTDRVTLKNLRFTYLLTDSYGTLASVRAPNRRVCLIRASIAEDMGRKVWDPL